MPTKTPTSNKQPHPTRLGTAPTSLRVQLPAERFIDSFSNGSTSRDTAVQPRGQQRQSQPQRPQRSSGGAANGSSQAGPSRQQLPPVQTTDAALLAQGIMDRRQKAKEIMAVQERLMEDRDISREELKKSLTQLAVPHWLQINQERFLASQCGYPLCRNPATQPSTRTGLYRISVARRAIEKDTSNDAGGRNNFCSQRCFACSEWVRRWVLEPTGGATGMEDEAKTIDQAVRGGMWEALMNRREEEWEEIELLEDLEEKGDLDGYEGYGRGSVVGRVNGDGFTDTDTTTSRASQTLARVPAPTPTPAPPPPTSLLSSLTINERRKGDPTQDHSARPHPRNYTPHTTRDQDDTFDSLLSLGSASTLKSSIVQQRQADALADDETDEEEEDQPMPEDSLKHAQRSEEQRMFDEALGLRDVLRQKEDYDE